MGIATITINHFYIAAREAIWIDQITQSKVKHNNGKRTNGLSEAYIEDGQTVTKKDKTNNNDSQKIRD